MMLKTRKQKAESFNDHINNIYFIVSYKYVKQYSKKLSYIGLISCCLNSDNVSLLKKMLPSVTVTDMYREGSNSHVLSCVRCW